MICLLCHKPYPETEVLVLGVHPTQAGILCRTKNGEELLVRCDGATFTHPPSIGTIITVRYEGVS